MQKRDLYLIIGAMVLALVLGVWLFWPETVEPGSWGLSFRDDGQPPTGPANAAALRQYDAAYLGDTGEKVLYLTFDAGYENGCTEKILDILQKHQVKAAFFLVGNYLEQNPELVRRMVQDGHIVGNHTWHHYDMSQISDREVFAGELEDVAEKYREITGGEMQKYYRPPQGIYSEENLKMAKELGYHTVFWSLAYKDWETGNQKGADYAFDSVIPYLYPGCVLLLHAVSSDNTEALGRIIDEARNQGYTFKSLDEFN